jgi:hypothetical protein
MSGHTSEVARVTFAVRAVVADLKGGMGGRC